MPIDGLLSGWAFLLGRVLFGGVLAFNGVNHFLNADGMAEMAGANGVPAPRAMVYATGALLLAGGLSVVLGVYPALGALALLAFLLVTTPWIHDFWNLDDPEERQQQMTHFLKNTALVGGAFLFLGLAATDWPLAAGIGLV